MLGDYNKCVICGKRGVHKQTEKGFICDDCLKED
jgi:hypothetical protein